jgi:hypothetical protein
MNINLHIERLILEGLPVRGSESRLVQAAIESELTRLLARSELSGHSSEFATRTSVRDIALSHNNNPAQLGRSIGKSVHSAISTREFDSLSEKSTKRTNMKGKAK